MDSACPENDVTEILSDTDHSNKVAPTTLIINLLVLDVPVLYRRPHIYSFAA